ncbi:MAG: sulfurtransferase TusA family protein [Rubellimicrobium sp.]|nr:sulfurtransferase TusA family protein [Rubellimicrobium sp.]
MHAGGTVEVDARDLLCPLPVLRARKVLLGLPEGTLVRVLATDAMARIDLPHFCAQSGHTHLSLTDEDGAQVHVIRRGPDRPEADA